jgi:hypothetical protein
MTIKFTNNAISTLASGITNSATSITVASGDGSKFPSLTGSEYFRATLIDASNNLEIVKVTARSSDVLTVTRAQESTTARAFSSGDRIELRITAQSLLDAATTLTSLVADLDLNSNNITGTGAISCSGDLTIDTSTLKVDSTNNRVGIGDSSPDGLLHVGTGDNSDGTDVDIIIGGNSANARQSKIRKKIQSSDRALEFYASANTSDEDIRFYSDVSTERMRLESDGDLHVDGDVIAFSTTVSDVALKSDIEMIPNALDKIDEVRGVTFTRHNGQKSAGIIAQELEKVLPEAVREKKLALHDGKEYKTVEYDAIHGLLINCIKELKEEIKELKNGFTK